MTRGARPDPGRFGVVDPRSVWRSDERELDDFRHHLSERDQRTLRAAIGSLVESGTPVDEVRTDDLPLGGLVGPLTALRHELMDGSGFALVDGFPVDDLSPRELEYFWWRIGLALGAPVSQSVMGERLGHVRDVTTTDPNARAYRNKSELTPHTDPADILGFLCVHPAARGGASRFSSSMAVHEEIRRTRPDLLERLYRGFRYHRLGEESPGSAPITPHRVPVFSSLAGVTSCRYVRQYIEVAADEREDIVLETSDVEALDLFEEIAGDPRFHFEFSLSSGEAVFANNFTVLHARTAFEDDPSLPARHLLRLWLSTDPRRPIRPEVLHYDGEPGIAPVAGRVPSYATNVTVQ